MLYGLIILIRFKNNHQLINLNKQVSVLNSIYVRIGRKQEYNT